LRGHLKHLFKNVNLKALQETSVNKVGEQGLTCVSTAKKEIGNKNSQQEQVSTGSRGSSSWTNGGLLTFRYLHRISIHILYIKEIGEDTKPLNGISLKTVVFVTPLTVQDEDHKHQWAEDKNPAVFCRNFAGKITCILFLSYGSIVSDYHGFIAASVWVRSWITRAWKIVGVILGSNSRYYASAQMVLRSNSLVAIMITTESRILHNEKLRASLNEATIVTRIWDARPITYIMAYKSEGFGFTKSLYLLIEHRKQGKKTISAGGLLIVNRLRP